MGKRKKKVTTPDSIQDMGFLVPEPKMLAIGMVIMRAEDVVNTFDEPVQRDPDDFIDNLACYVMDLHKALVELKEMK